MSGLQVGKVEYIGSYVEFCKKMIAKGSSITLERVEKEHSEKALTYFNKFDGYIGENKEYWTSWKMEFDEFSKSEDTETTHFSIDTKNYTEEEINEAMYRAYVYLERCGSKDEKKEFKIYKN